MQRTRTRQSTSAAAMRSAAKCAVESLESRTMMSVTVKVVFDSSNNAGLLIKGDSKNDTVIICDDQANGDFSVKYNTSNGWKTVTYQDDYTDDFNYEQFLTFDVDLQGGKDCIEYKLIGGQEFYDRSLHLDGDAGDDKITVLTTFDSVMTTLEEEEEEEIPEQNSNGDPEILDILIDGDSGNDKVDVKLGYFAPGETRLHVLTYEGNDEVKIDLGETLLWANDVSATQIGLCSSFVDVDVDLGNGKNSLTLTTFGLFDYWISDLNIEIQGGNSTGSNVDTVCVIIGDHNAGSFHIVTFLGAGDDKFELKDSSVRIVQPAFIINGGSAETFITINGQDGKDKITADLDHLDLGFSRLELPEEEVELNETEVSGTEKFFLTIRGGNQDDTLTAYVDAFVGHSGLLNLTIDGQNNKDTINAYLDFDIPDEQAGSLAVSETLLPGVTVALLGGQHEDTFSVDATLGGGLINYLTRSNPYITPVGGPILIDGQSNQDTLKRLYGDPGELFNVWNVEKVK